MEARDYIAIITLTGSFILLALKVDSLVGAVLIAVISYYFGMEHSQRRPRKHLKKRSIKSRA